MNLSHPSVCAWWKIFVVAEVHQRQSAAYRWIMQQLKRLMKVATVQLFLKINAVLERLLKTSMRWLHFVERTAVFCGLGRLFSVLFKMVQQDGLKLLLMLTVLGYTTCFLFCL